MRSVRTVLALLLHGLLANLVKDVPLGKKLDALGNTLGGDLHLEIEPDNYWVELYMKATAGTLAGGTTPAFAADAMDRLVKKLTFNFGGSLNPIQASILNLKRLYMLEHGEELPADGYAYIPFGGAFPAHVFANGLRLQHEFETLANLTTGSPTSQSSTKVEWFARQFPRIGKPGNVVGYPKIKTIEKDLVSVAGRKEVVNLNTGDLLRHMLIIPSSGTLINEVEVSIGDGEDVLRKHKWADLREQNKKDYFFDAVQPAAGFTAYSFPNLPTDKGAVGRLSLFADVNSEASGKVTVVTMERMHPGDEAKIMAKLSA